MIYSFYVYLPVTLIKQWIDKQLLNIDVNTVNAFQGQERRVILISTVRGKGYTKYASLGFVKDCKRFNIALTRAKAKAVVIGNPISLRTSQVWSEYIRKCERLGSYYSCLMNDGIEGLVNATRNVKI